LLDSLLQERNLLRIKQLTEKKTENGFL